ncbi:HD domain-containing phosphohydrolase [Candidatus Riflebacteria bacterium]
MATNKCYIYLSNKLGSAKYQYFLKENGFPVNVPWKNPDATSDKPIIYFVSSQDFNEKFEINTKDLPITGKGEKIYILILDEEERILNEYEDNPSVFSLIREPVSKKTMFLHINNAVSYLTARKQAKFFELGFEEQNRKLKQLNAIGVALSAEPNSDKLLELILKKSKAITNGDAGSIYLVVEFSDNTKYLQYKFTENDTLSVAEAKDVTMQISMESIAGYVALTGDVVNIEDAYKMDSGSVPYSFNPSFDKTVGYKTCSMIVVPMKDHHANITGVIQLINKKKHLGPIPDFNNITASVIPFGVDDQEILESLASQAAIALENANLVKNVQDLFEGFVNASVTAIESRDPTTSGHSFRVAELTVELARSVNKDTRYFKDFLFTDLQIKELRYACLLHDFGKVGVRENVLVKAKKLYPYEMEMIKLRFDLFKKDILTKALNEKLKVGIIPHMTMEEKELSFKQFDDDAQIDINLLEERLNLIVAANEPTILEEGNFYRIIEIAKEEYIDSNGNHFPYLSEDEVSALSIRRGSLSHSERVEIESHVTHTYKFLSKIPWTADIKNIPSIAYAHHEWLNGNGYPNNLIAEEIPIQSKIMAIADIFDALTASDRPYKKAVSVDIALKILKEEVKTQHIDKKLVDLFIEDRVYEVINVS